MANSALLVMDVQRDIVDIADDGSGYLPRLSRAIDGARAAGIPVIYVAIALRPDDPGVSPRNRVITNAVRDGLFAEGAAGTEIHHDVAPREGDIVVTKRRGSAFSGSDLDLVLRARDIDSLVVTGIATSGVVLSTLCQAVDLDLGLTVLVDACLDTDPELHRVLTERLFPRWGDVIPVEDWLRAVAPRKAVSSNNRG
ncbi:cysteine hydrolase [Streptomyces sp. NBC_01260]|uniref:cysteine hydrolase family protein n=1 Tax=unclassified Streptomyces TaxID=2593676 RepID=UPI000F47593B|nr:MULTISPECIES: cysteine hydrolase [unclassified Streptomyces]MCX4769043.1 cysteine hydrolase [Streptomyces sp. NBC_01285]ROQ76815.1 nicotinamidase-related amidase [Streptomyces sp. CEV 2-1]RPK40907.1 Isochorismatase family protein YecD [Streptomyces sp. ADI92-24]